MVDPLDGCAILPVSAITNRLFTDQCMPCGTIGKNISLWWHRLASAGHC